MLDLIALVWHFLLAQPPVQLVRLVSWHLLAVLVGLGLLSAFGLHFLVGHVFRFYRRKDRLARWVAWPTLLVFLVSVQGLLVGYLLAVQAPSIVHANLTGDVTARLGRLLLEPAFEQPVLAVHGPDDVPKGALGTALRALSELDYRDRLRGHVVPPRAMADAAAVAGHPRVGGAEVLVQLGLRWVTEPHASGYAAGRAPEGQPPPERSEEPFFLPDFLAGLVDELQEGTVLPRLDWEHVAGTRFVEGVLRPLVVEYLSYLALALAIAVLLLDAVYFLLMRRLKRIGQPRPAKARPAPKPASLPVPATGSAPDAVPAGPAAPKAANPGEPAPAAVGTPSDASPPAVDKPPA